MTSQSYDRYIPDLDLNFSLMICSFGHILPRFMSMSACRLQPRHSFSTAAHIQASAQTRSDPSSRLYSSSFFRRYGISHRNTPTTGSQFQFRISSSPVRAKLCQYESACGSSTSGGSFRSKALHYLGWPPDAGSSPVRTPAALKGACHPPVQFALTSDAANHVSDGDCSRLWVSCATCVG